MKKLMILSASMLLSTGVYAKSLDQKVKEIEAKKEAKCEYKKTRPAVCLGDVTLGAGVCTFKVVYKCLPDDVTKKPFTVKIRVRQVGNNEPVVRSTTYQY